MILSRLLLPEEYGFVALITVFTEFIRLFTDSGISFAVIRSDFKSTYHKAVHSISITIGIFLFLLMLGLSFPIAYFYNDPSLVVPTMVFSLIFIFKTLQAVPYGIYAKELNFNKIGQVNLISSVIMIIAMIIMAALGFSYWSLIIPVILMDASAYILYNRKIKIKPTKKLSHIKAAWKKTKSLLKNLSLFNAINYWSRNGDNLIIGKMYGTHSLGIYNRGYQFLMMSLNLITGIFGAVLYPSLQKLKNEGGNVNKEYTSILGVISIINLPFAVPLIIIPNWFVLILWGKDWLDVAELLPYFGVLIMGQTLISTGGSIFVLYKKEKVLSLLGVIQSVALVTGIVIGAMISVKMVLICYSINYLFIVVPATLYLGFYKSFRYSIKEILIFWTPKLISYLGMMVTIYLNKPTLTYSFLTFLIIHIFYFQRNELGQLISLVRTKLLKKNHNE
jgi:O-antigen/teichoic acid export membrane protein